VMRSAGTAQANVVQSWSYAMNAGPLAQASKKT
jgi:hypothetical protein